MDRPSFEWNEHKADRNKTKHGVDFEEALTVFADPLAIVFDDVTHSDEELRQTIIGHSTIGRLLLVSFGERWDLVRIISARPVTRQERHDYEEKAT